MFRVNLCVEEAQSASRPALASSNSNSQGPLRESQRARWNWGWGYSGRGTATAGRAQDARQMAAILCKLEEQSQFCVTILYCSRLRPALAGVGQVVGAVSGMDGGGCFVADLTIAWGRARSSVGIGRTLLLSARWAALTSDRGPAFGRAAVEHPIAVQNQVAQRVLAVGLSFNI